MKPNEIVNAKKYIEILDAKLPTANSDVYSQSNGVLARRGSKPHCEGRPEVVRGQKKLMFCSGRVIHPT